MGNLTVEEHYDKTGLAVRVQGALDQAGIGGPGRDWREFAPLDQFHVRGLEATTELANRLSLGSEQTLLDVGCGLGGPARHLAAEFGTRITGIDLSEPFIDVARLLTEKAELSDRLDFQVANALNLPFADSSFDIVWTQHVAMNIADRPALYGELFRVLKPGGKLAIYDVLLGSGEPLVFPVPWAAEPAISHVVTVEEMRVALEGAGFVELGLWDMTGQAIEWMEKQATGAREGRPLGLHVVMGPEFGGMVANLVQNVRLGRLKLVQAVLQKS